MTSSKPKLANLICLRLDENMLTAIRKSGQNTSDWLRQAIRYRIESDRLTEAAPSHLEKQVAALQQRIDDLKKDGADTRKEIARFQQSESITQATLAEMRKVLVAIQGNQAELQRALVAMENGIGNTLAALGPTLLAAINQQIDQHAQAALDAAKAKEERLRALVPPAPPRTRL